MQQDHIEEGVAVQKFGQALREWREHSNMTLRELGEGINMDPATIHRVESGKTNSVPFKTICKIAVVLDRDPNQMAEAFGYWKPKSRSQDPRIQQLSELVTELPVVGRTELLEDIELLAERYKKKYHL